MKFAEVRQSEDADSIHDTVQCPLDICCAVNTDGEDSESFMSW